MFSNLHTACTLTSMIRQPRMACLPARSASCRLSQPLTGESAIRLLSSSWRDSHLATTDAYPESLQRWHLGVKEHGLQPPSCRAY